MTTRYQPTRRLHRAAFAVLALLATTFTGVLIDELSRLDSPSAIAASASPRAA